MLHCKLNIISEIYLIDLKKSFDKYQQTHQFHYLDIIRDIKYNSNNYKKVL